LPSAGKQQLKFRGAAPILPAMSAITATLFVEDDVSAVVANLLRPAS
jgi:hypothetical protein